MKKLFFFLSVAVLGIAAASCQKELAVAEGGKGNVSITIQTPEVATKAIADGMNVDIVYYEIYKNEAGHKNSLTGTPLIKNSVRMSAKGASLTLNLLQGQEYVGLFWAQVEGDKYYDVENLRNVQVKYPNEENNLTYANDEARAAFCKSQVFGTGSNVKVVLERPFAQINLGTTMSSIDKTVNGYEINLKESSMTVKGVANSFNVADMTAGTTATSVEFSYATLPYAFNPSETLVANDKTWAYAGMNYVLVPGDAATVDVTYSIKTDVGTVTRNVPVVPVKKNFRTNLLGNLLTQETTIDIVVDEKFNTPDQEPAPIYMAAANGGEFTLTEDVTLAEPLKIQAPLVLDLNGYTITAGLKQEGRHHYAIDNYAHLTLVGAGAINARGVQNFGTMVIDGDITITNVDTNGGSAIWNEGDLTINNGTFTTNSEAGEGSYGAALNTRAGGTATVNGGNFSAYSQLTYAIINEGTTTINNATVKSKHGAVAGASSAKTTIYGGSFELMENPGISDHCVYKISDIKGGTFTLGNNTDSGAQVFYESTIAEGYKAVENGTGVYTVIPNSAVIAANNEEFQRLLGNNEVDMIYLNAGKYVGDFYSGTAARQSLTIVGTTGTQFAHSATTGGQLQLSKFERFTIRNCEILLREVPKKDWGMMVFGESGKENGVYTVSNCTFNGVGTQGIYINEKKSGAVYNIENCTFNGDFGSEGAITIQDNDNVNFIVNVNGCAFNNIPSTSHEVCLIYGNGVFTLNSDVELEVYTK